MHYPPASWVLSTGSSMTGIMYPFQVESMSLHSEHRNLHIQRYVDTLPSHCLVSSMVR